MGVDTNLLISSEWELDDIRTVIKKYLNTKVKVRDCSKTSIGFFQFVFNVENTMRTLSVFTNHKTSVGVVTLLKLSYNEQAIRIMKTIAGVFGGLLEEKDDVGTYENIQGMFSRSNGISYFFEYAVLNNEIEGENDLVGLNESIHRWHEKIKERKNNMRLFSKNSKEAVKPRRS